MATSPAALVRWTTRSEAAKTLNTRRQGYEAASAREGPRSANSGGDRHAATVAAGRLHTRTDQRDRDRAEASAEWTSTRRRWRPRVLGRMRSAGRHRGHGPVPASRAAQPTRSPWIAGAPGCKERRNRSCRSTPGSLAASTATKAAAGPAGRHVIAPHRQLGQAQGCHVISPSGTRTPAPPGCRSRRRPGPSPP